MAVKIVTDSTADIPDKYIKQYGIGVVPLNIHFGEEVLKDGVDIWSDEFYHRLKNEALLPNTSQPAPGEFLEVYQAISEPGDTIISLHVSEAMSGTAGSARIAAGMLADRNRIEVIDSQYACMGLGMIVMRLAQMAIAGAELEDIVSKLSSLREKLTVYFTVNSLEYLSRTGRIGKAAALLGGLLNIKPILEIEDGVIAPVEKVRGNFQKVAVEMVGKLSEKYGDQPLELWLVHSELPELITTLQREAEKKLHIAKSYSGIIGPVVGAHAGPYTVGAIALPAS